MTWELVSIGCLLLLISGIALWTMKKTKRPVDSNISIDIKDLATEIAKANAIEMRQLMQEFLSELKSIRPQSFTRSHDDFEITIDESVIPIDVAVNVESVNLDAATKEQNIVDKGLTKSKSKLSGLFKKKATKE